MPVEVAFGLSGEEVGFSVGAYDRNHPLISDPTYSWHTFYGSVNSDQAIGLAVDSGGNLSVTGYSTATWSGPEGQSPLHAYTGGYDLYVLKLNSSGAYQWHTFYGSANLNLGMGLAVDVGGNIYVSGYSNATWDGPEGQVPLHAYRGNTDIVVLKLNSSGAYQWHTFYGSVNSDQAIGWACEAFRVLHPAGRAG